MDVLDPKTFYIIPLTDMLIFGTLVFLAFRARSNPPAHKRLILVATTALTLAAVARWPIPFIQHHPLWVAELCTYGFLALLLAYDVYSTGKVHRVTIWASAFLIAVQRLRVPLGETVACTLSLLGPRTWQEPFMDETRADRFSCAHMPVPLS